MTFEEAKEYGEEYLRDLTVAVCKVEEKHKNFVRMAIQALAEIQQYRAIGTVEKLKTMFDGFWKLKDLCEEYEKYGLLEDYWKLSETCKEYSAIGTIEEFKDLKEKDTPMKPIVRGLGQRYCPICKCGGADHFYCTRCGQKLG